MILATILPAVPTRAPAFRKFIVGETYSTRSACDYECVFAFTVVRRTAKFVTLQPQHGDEVRVGIKTTDKGEWCYPQGRFSMAPVINA